MTGSVTGVFRRAASALASLGGETVLPATPAYPEIRAPGGLRRLLPGIFGGVTQMERLAEGRGFALRSMRLGGRTRRYYVFLPEGLTSSQALVVLALHGGGGRALPFLPTIRAERMARQHGFVLVAPQGAGPWWSAKGSWNADSATRLGYAEVNEVDDVGFLSAALAAVFAELDLAPAPACVMGFSKGGMMAYRLACVQPGQIGAIAVVAGTLSSAEADPGEGPISVMHIHGTQDRNVPPEGGSGAHSAPGADWPPIEAGLNRFRRAIGAAADAVPKRAAADTTCWRSTGADGSVVEYCEVDGGGHAWPGSAPRAWQVAQGDYVSPHFDATEHIARFFRAQVAPGRAGGEGRPSP
ncbi:MAG: hypothetical protein AAGG09_23165 [Pseudomonadota bacterium]